MPWPVLRSPVRSIAFRCHAARRVRRHLTHLILASGLLAACAGPDAAPPADTVVVTRLPAPDTAPGDTSYRLRPGYVVDSLRPIEEELRRFRGGLAPVRAFEGGAPSVAELVDRVVRGVARRDTAALRALALTRAEFAWLVYPDSRYTRPPYRQAPGLVWLQLERAGGTGLRRLLDRLGGQTLRPAGHRCDGAPEVEGGVRLWRGCRVALVRAPGDTTRARLFGVVVERDGRFKIANYANDF